MLPSLPLGVEVGRALGILFAGGSGIRFPGGCCCGNYPSNPLPALLSRSHLEKLVISAPCPSPGACGQVERAGGDLGGTPRAWVFPWTYWSTLLIPSTRPGMAAAPPPPPLLPCSQNHIWLPSELQLLERTKEETRAPPREGSPGTWAPPPLQLSFPHPSSLWRLLV